MAPVSLRSVLPISAKARTEADRIDAILVDSLSSPLSIERRRMESRIMGVAEEDPEGMVGVLLRYTEVRNDTARESVMRLLREITATREGKAAVLENLSNKDQEVRKGVRAMMIELWGEEASRFAADYEQAVLMINLARSRDIFVEDIVTLADLVKVTLLEGETTKAYEDVALVLELIKHRYRSVETMKNYLAEMLKITPELSKLGMMSGRIEESLRVASRANKQRRFEFTKDLIEDRMREVQLIDQLRALGVTVKGQINDPPHVSLERLSGMDVWVFARLKELVGAGTTMSVTERKEEVIELVDSFLRDELFPYIRDKAQDRLEAGDASLLFALYTVGLTCLKLISEPLPKVAEELYVTYFRDLEGSPSIATVSWPSAVL